MNVRNQTELVRPSGVVVAVLGFAITRFVVAGTLQVDSLLSFGITIAPLLVGFGLTVFGIVLAVGGFSRGYANTVALWTVLGSGVMVAVLGLTALGATLEGQGGFGMLRDSQLLVANTILGGAVGGALTGDRAALGRNQRNEIELQAELAMLTNERLRHEVLNAATVIDGYAALFETDEATQRDVAAIRESTDRIESTVVDLGDVGRAQNSESLEPIDVVECFRTEAAAFRERNPDIDLEVTSPESAVYVLADRRLALLVRKLLESAADGETSGHIIVDIAVENGGIVIEVSTTDGTLGDASAANPTTSFDRRIVELLVDYYDGETGLRVTDDTEVGGSKRATTSESPSYRGAADGGTRTTSARIRLPRATGDGDSGGRIGVQPQGLAAAVIAGLVGGVVMGFTMHVLAGLLPVIGALYGIENPLIGWVTHLFHSVVFALLFAAGYTHFRRTTDRGGALESGGLAVGWGVFLWLVAAGVVMPLWLRLVDIPAVLPNLTAVGLAGHVIWGLTVGVTYAFLRGRLGDVERLRSVRTAFDERFGNLGY